MVVSMIFGLSDQKGRGCQLLKLEDFGVGGSLVWDMPIKTPMRSCRAGCQEIQRRLSWGWESSQGRWYLSQKKD